MTHQYLRRLFTGLPGLALALVVLFLSACGESQPDVTSTSEARTAQAVPTTASTSVSSTAAPTTTAPTPAPVRDENWDLEFTVELAEPDAYSLGGFGDMVFHIAGDQVQATGVVTIGDATYDELVFDGVLDGDQFTLATTEFPVEPAYGDDVGREDVTLELPPFAFTGDTMQATGSILIITTPWAPTKTGALTISLCKSVK